MSRNLVRRIVAWVILAGPFIALFGCIVVDHIAAGYGWHVLAGAAGFAVFVWLFIWAINNVD